MGCCMGVMNWPLEAGWKCKYCGKQDLSWAITHAEAHCQDCHAVYRLRDKDNNLVSVPIDSIKPDYGVAYLNIPIADRKPMNQMSESDWNKALNESAK